MILLMRDAISASDIPLQDLAAVAGYADGRWQWTPEDWARFPDSIIRLSIAVHPQDAADILDVEIGDATPDDIPDWCDRFDRPRRRAPTVYCSLNNWPACVLAAGARKVDWWVADYATEDPAGVRRLGLAVAIQHWSFVGYDQSVVFDPSWLDTPQEDPMANIDMKRATVLNCRVASFGVWPTELAEVDSYAAMINDDYSNVLEILDRMVKDYIRNGGKPFWASHGS